MNELITKTFLEQKQNRWKVSSSTASERIAKLKKLKMAILESEADLKLALLLDFRKPEPETEISEIFPVLEELNHAIRHLSAWMSPKSTSVPLALLGSSTKTCYEARGVVLILAPWNYPFQLFMNPIIAAIAAGNCVIARGSEKTAQTSKYMKALIEKVFTTNEVAIFEGDIEEAEFLLTLPFDHIFFTGSTFVGRKVMMAAAQNLSTVTLELGGKSPTILLEDADFTNAVGKIVWAKFFNAGQTCVAPDYVFVPESRESEFLAQIKIQIESVFGASSSEKKSNPDLARIIDSKAFLRLSHLIDDSIKNGAQVITGNERDQAQNFISPTVIGKVKKEHALMSQEIFGPILPVMTYTKIEDVILHIQSNDKPLALYVFGKNKSVINKVLSLTSSGAAVVNHLMIHFINPNSPIGGVGPSGQGSYHGFYGFKTFSHERVIVTQGPISLTSWLFPPYKNRLAQIALRFLKILSR